MIVILGAGGHARSLIPLITDSGLVVEGVYDEIICPSEEIYKGVFLKGTVDQIPTTAQIVLAFGSNEKRKQLFDRFQSFLYKSNLRHPSAIVRSSKLGVSNQIFPQSYIGYGTSVLDNNIINTAAIIEHECSIGCHCHISVNSTICGRVKIGDHCFIGAGSTIIDNLTICDNVTIGAGSVVVRSIDEEGTYVGSPARKITR